jgi:hypothetical protein
MVPQALFFWAENRMEAERVSTDVTFSADFCTAKVSIPALGSNAFFATPPACQGAQIQSEVSLLIS